MRCQIVISAFNMYGTTWNNFCPSECRGNITWLTESKSFCTFVPIIETVHTTLTFLSKLNYIVGSFKACDNSTGSCGSTLVIFLFFFEKRICLLKILQENPWNRINWFFHFLKDPSIDYIWMDEIEQSPYVVAKSFSIFYQFFWSFLLLLWFQITVSSFVKQHQFYKNKFSVNFLRRNNDVKKLSNNAWQKLPFSFSVSRKTTDSP